MILVSLTVTFRMTQTIGFLDTGLCLAAISTWNEFVKVGDQSFKFHHPSAKEGMKHVWHGSIAENIVSSTARDILVSAMVALECGKQFEPVFTVHDEVVCEGPEYETTENFESILRASIPQYVGKLMKVDTKLLGRYSK